MRPHLSLDVRNVPASVEFYQKFFGVAPQKQTTDYAKFDLKEPAVVQITRNMLGRLSCSTWATSCRHFERDKPWARWIKTRLRTVGERVQIG